MPLCKICTYKALKIVCWMNELIKAISNWEKSFRIQIENWYSLNMNEIFKRETGVYKNKPMVSSMLYIL